MKKMLREAELQRVQGELRRADVKTGRRWLDENISSGQRLSVVSAGPRCKKGILICVESDLVWMQELCA